MTPGVTSDPSMATWLHLKAATSNPLRGVVPMPPVRPATAAEVFPAHAGVKGRSPKGAE